MRKLSAAIALAALLVGSPAFAVDDLDKANLGEHWYGPKRTLEELKGHVVFWENWGFQ